MDRAHESRASFNLRGVGGSSGAGKERKHVDDRRREKQRRRQSMGRVRARIGSCRLRWLELQMLYSWAEFCGGSPGSVELASIAGSVKMCAEPPPKKCGPHVWATKRNGHLPELAASTSARRSTRQRPRPHQQNEVRAIWSKRHQELL